MAEARALTDDRDGARRRLDELARRLDRGVGIYPEMVDPDSGAFLGNLPQGLTHLANIAALSALDQEPPAR